MRFKKITLGLILLLLLSGFSSFNIINENISYVNNDINENDNIIENQSDSSPTDSLKFSEDINKVYTPPSVKKIAADIRETNHRLTEEEIVGLSEKIVQFSKQSDLDEYLVASILYTESRYNQNAQSSSGAIGLGQLTPICIKELGENYDRWDMDDNLLATTKYIKKMLILFNNDTDLALAAYTAGPTLIRKNNSFQNYPEVKHYVNNVKNKIVLIKKED